jgi:hypothetical protein
LKKNQKTPEYKSYHICLCFAEESNLWDGLYDLHEVAGSSANTVAQTQSTASDRIHYNTEDIL